jgi:uncharacterized membrane protein HdeD (DUF308 family)
MPDEKLSKGPDTTNRGPDSGDWRDQRRQWREERWERRNRDPLRGLFWGLILILFGILFFVNLQQGTSWDVLWKYVLVGLGAIFIIDGLAHLRAERAYSNFGRFIPGVILLFVGLAFLYNFSQWWPVILIAVGLVILIALFFRRR